LGTQLVAVSRPFAGHYASYQATVMASISRNMVRDNFANIVLPKTDSIINGERSLHLNQYPFPALVAALGEVALGGGLEFWGRFQAIFFNVLSVILLGFIARRLFGATVGWLSFGIYALSPYTMIYGQSFMSEQISVFALLVSLFALLYLDGERSDLVKVLLSGLAFSAAVTGRIHYASLFPVYAFLIFRSGGERWMMKLILFGLLSAAMPIAWYAHTYFAAWKATNIHTSIFLQMGEIKAGGANLLGSLQFYQVLFDTVAQRMMTPILFPFLVLGFFVMKRGGNAFWLIVTSITIGSSVILLFPQKVLTHDFYLYNVFPFLAIVAACGLAPLLESFPALKSVRIGFVLILLYFGISGRYFFNPMFKVPESTSYLKQIATLVEAHSSPEQPIIVVGDDIGSALYYVNRPVWGVQLSAVGGKVAPYLKNARFKHVDEQRIKELEHAMRHPITWIEYLRREGGTFLVVPDSHEIEAYPDLLKYLKLNYKELAQDPNYYLFQLVTVQ